MALTSNPTRTRRIENAWLSEIRRRWRRFQRVAVERLQQLNEGALLTNADPFVLSAEQQRAYMVFLQAQIDAILLEGGPSDSWQKRYQLESYRRGLETTRASLIAQGVRIQPTEVERLAAQGISAIGATLSLGLGVATAAPIHADAFAFITQRAYDSLEGWTDTMATGTRQVLFDAVAEGKGIDVVTRELKERIGVSRSRAELIARTETNQAYARASIAEVTRSNDETGDDVLMRWITVRDSKVRHLHAGWHGVLMTPEKAAQNKNVSPHNCRCGFAPVLPEADTKAKRDKFTRERKALVAQQNEKAA